MLDFYHFIDRLTVSSCIVVRLLLLFSATLTVLKFDKILYHLNFPVNANESLRKTYRDSYTFIAPIFIIL